MVRRSAPALLGLFVCLLAAHLSSAAPAFQIDETRIRLSLDEKQAVVRLELDNATGRETNARLRVELLDPKGSVRASAHQDVRVRRGANAFDVPLQLPYSELLDAERKEFPWFRLRYRVEPSAAPDAPPALEGIVSVSEVMPDLFELRVVSAREALAGSRFTARVRTANPLTQRPVRGVAVEATLALDEGDKKSTLKAHGVTDGEGIATLSFELPRTAADEDEIELKVSARRGSFVENASTYVDVEQRPRVLLTTDKPLYQPGQTVHMRALVFDQSEHALGDAEVTLTVEDEEGSDAFTTTLKTSRYGVASADWRVPDSTKLGGYTVKLELEDERYDTDAEFETVFRIGRYDLPNFSVTTKPDRSFYLKDQRPSIEVRADYLFGQPVKRGRVRVVRQTERHWNYKAQKYETEEFPAVEGELREGLYVARLDLSDEQKELNEAGYQRFRDLDFVAYVTDPTTNRTEQRRFSLRLTKEPIHIYVNEGRYLQAKGLPLAFYLSTSYADGTPAVCDVTVYEEGESGTEYGADGRRHEVRAADRALVRARTNRYGVAKVAGPTVAQQEERSNIPLRFVARDREGRVGRLSEDLWLGGGSTPELRIETDKTIYRAGEPVSVRLRSNAPDMRVVVDAIVEGRVVSTQTARLAAGRAALVIPTDADFAGAVIINAASATPTANDNDRYYPYDDYSVGTRTVVFPRDRELKLDVKLSRASYRPGEEADAQFSLRTADGRRAAGALGVVVFDKAVEERARTDGEASRGFGFGGSFHGLWYGYGEVAGVTHRDIERLDPARTPPVGLETVAEILYNSVRRSHSLRVSTGTDFERNLGKVFGEYITTQLAPLKSAVDAHYARAAEYPADEAALLRLLSQAGVDFNALRDPWGRAYRARFHFENELDRLDLYSDGADERPWTDDDFMVGRFAWPYFRKTGEALLRAASAYHERTNALLRDLSTLSEEARRAGLDLDSLRDRWGRPYRFELEVSGTYESVVVKSSGPDKTFEQAGKYGDDFVVWKASYDYFADERQAVDRALAENFRETKSFPQTREALVAALAKSPIGLDALRDGWGRPVYLNFTNEQVFTDRVSVESRRRFDAEGGTHREVKPVTQTLYTVALRSAGADRREGTPDDFTLGYFSSIAKEQSATDAEPINTAPVTTFSGGTGAINGTVSDPQGAAIPGVTVTAKHDFTNFVYTAKTNEEGSYLLRNLPSGLYTLTFDAQGFQRTVIERVGVQSSNLTKVDAALSPGGVMETVTVSAEASMLETSSSQLSMVVKREIVNQLPPLSTPRLREFFPETLVWNPELETTRDGTARLNFKLADNITTWKMSVIASTEDGRLGTAEHEFLAFQPFFVEHDPPRVLTEGDEISLPVVLRNYLPKPLGVDVEMKPESWFVLGGASRQRASVAAGEAARPTFDFRAVASVVDGKQRVTALGLEASDAIEKPVTVHPDGEERSNTDAAILTGSAVLSAKLPADVVRGSARGELKLYPNLAAHVLEGVEAIMSRPYGCGEQTISSSYPSVLVLDYERGFKGGGVGGEIAARARKYARVGYERLLGYRAPGGGFTYWGRGEPDVALTAYALRFLTDASRVMEVDDDVIRETREWLLRRQRADGSWPAPYDDKNRAALTTVYVARVIAAQSSLTKNATAEHSTSLKRALEYVSARSEEIDEPYLIASLALAAADAGEQALFTRAVTRLPSLANAEGTGTYWALETNTPFYGWGLAGRVETTALAVNALNRYCRMPEADCGANGQLIERGLDFLLKKKDRYGVWYSTQATINVFDTLLSAIGSRGGAGAAQAEDVAEVFVNGRPAGRLTLPPSDRLSGPLLLDLTPFVGAGDNRVELRRRADAPPAQAQLVTTFYVPWGERKELSEAADATKRSTASTLKLSVAYDRTSAGVSQEVTCSVAAERVGHRGYGMLLAEVGLPPGADVDRASLEHAMQESGWALNGYDVLPDRLVLYLWPQGGGTRFRFKFRPRYGLNALTAPSQLYDYYNPEARTVVPPTRFVVR